MAKVLFISAKRVREQFPNFDPAVFDITEAEGVFIIHELTNTNKFRMTPKALDTEAVKVCEEALADIEKKLYFAPMLRWPKEKVIGLSSDKEKWEKELMILRAKLEEPTDDEIRRIKELENQLAWFVEQATAVDVSTDWEE